MEFARSLRALKASLFQTGTENERPRQMIRRGFPIAKTGTLARRGSRDVAGANRLAGAAPLPACRLKALPGIASIRSKLRISIGQMAGSGAVPMVPNAKSATEVW